MNVTKSNFSLIFSKLFTGDENSCLFLTKAKYFSGLLAFVTSVLF